MKKPYLLIALIAVTFTGSQLAMVVRSQSSGQNYYFDSVSGSDSNSGTSEGQPWRTMGKLNSTQFAPGDDIFLKRGSNWSGSMMVVGRSGNSSSRITFQAYGSGERPIVSFSGGQWDPAVRVTGSYVTIKDIWAKDARYAGIHLDSPSRNVVVDGTKITNSGLGVRIDGQYNLVTRSDISDLKMIVNTQGGDDDWGAVGIWFNAPNNEASYNTVRNAIAPSYDYGYDGGVFEFYGNGDNTYVHHNYSENTDGFIEFGSGGNGSANNIRVSHNVVVDAGNIFWVHLSGTFATNLQNMKVENNTFANLTQNGQSQALPYVIGWSGSMTPSRLLFRNNIVYYKTNPNSTMRTEYLRANNLLYFEYDGSPELQSGEKYGDPSFVSVANRNFRLNSNSPAINAGINLGHSFDFEGSTIPTGSAPDIGAFEFGGTPATPTPPPSPTPTPTPTPTPPPSGGVTVRDHEFGSGYFVIEAENYNTGGEGVGFHDLNPGWDNALHRGSDGVDLTDLGSGNYAVNFMQTSEWLKYTLNVPTPGIYNVKFKASNNDGANSGALNLVVNSTNAGTVTINPTGSYSTFKDFSLNNISLSAGSNTFTVNVSDEWMDLDSIRFEIATATITCKGDYNNNGIVDISDFQLFGQNYKKTGLQCSYDIVGDDCLLTIADFQAFGQLYKVANACSTGSTPTPTPPPVNPPVTPPTNPPPVSGSYNPPAGIPAISITGAKFVSPDGNDSNAGTDSAPYKTINHGISQLQAGGTLVIKQGTYTVNSGSFVEGNSNAYLPIANKNGSANAWFKIVGDPRGSRPKIYAPWDGSSWQAFYIFQSSYIHLQYLEVYSNSSDAIRGKVSGVFSRNSHHVKVYDVWAHDGGGCGVCGQGSNHMEIRGNHVWNTSNWNEYNTSGISLIGVSNGGGGPDSSVSDSGGQYTNFIVGNLLWNNEAKVTFVAAPQWGVTDGNCIIMDVTNQQWRTLIANNICSDNAGRGVHAVHYNNADFFNNTLYQNVRSTMYSVRDGSELSSQDSSSIRFRNNVVWPRSDKNRFIMGGEASGNVWIGGNGGSSGVQAGTNTITRPDKNAPNGDWKINGQSDKGAPWPLEAFY